MRLPLAAAIPPALLLAAGTACVQWSYPTVVRVMAVSNRQDLAAAASLDAFAAEMAVVVGRAAPFLSLQEDGSGQPFENLVVLPEHVGLIAAFAGSRGEAARSAPTLASALAALGDAYATPRAEYEARFAGEAGASNPLLAASDTLARAWYGTFPALAREHGIHLVACAPLPDVESSPAPEDVAVFADPDLASPPEAVWVARSPEVRSRCTLWGPDGQELLTAEEISPGPEEVALLGLSGGDLDGVAGVTLGFGRVGIAVGADAGSGEVLDRLNGDGVAVVLNPRASWGPWCAYTGEDLDGDGAGDTWVPQAAQGTLVDAMTWEIWPGLLWIASPVLTGNLFDHAFDGQAMIARRNHELSDAATPLAAGAEPQDALAVVGPWAVEDPGVADPTLSLVQRREILSATAAALAPGSGADIENHYIHSVVWAEISLGGEPVD
ncbi:hypothetical protein L6R50_17060 [Myxococcota bacterium]|nr:hypothetical protein [Myxococcota bacterium]